MLGHARLLLAGDQNTGESLSLRYPVWSQRKPRGIGDTNCEIKSLGLAVRKSVTNVETESDPAFLCLLADNFRSNHEVLDDETAQGDGVAVAAGQVVVHPPVSFRALAVRSEPVYESGQSGRFDDRSHTHREAV
jgi:hypothetical protein